MSEFFTEMCVICVLYNNLIFTVFEALDIDSKTYVSFEFANNLRAPINIELIPRLIRQYKSSGSFYIQLILDQPLISLRAEVIWICCSLLENNITSICIAEHPKLFERHRE